MDELGESFTCIYYGLTYGNTSVTYALSIHKYGPFTKLMKLRGLTFFLNLHMKKLECFLADVMTVYEIGGPLPFPQGLL